MADNRSRIQVWPIDVGHTVEDADGVPLYWTAPMLWERERRNLNVEIVGWVKRGVDRGALVRGQTGIYYLLTPYGTSQTLDQRKVAAAVAAAGISV